MPISSCTLIQHWFHHLTKDPVQRAQTLTSIADARSQVGPSYVESEYGNKRLSYPHWDIKLNSNGPDMEMKLMRAKEVKGFNHRQVADAAWQSVFNFQLEIPERFKKFIKCEVRKKKKTNFFFVVD
jgi:hypothetical protein